MARLYDDTDTDLTVQHLADFLRNDHANVETIWLELKPGTDQKVRIILRKDDSGKLSAELLVQMCMRIE